MTTFIPLMSIDTNLSGRRDRAPRAPSRTHSAGHSPVLWIILAMVGVTTVAGVLLPAPSNNAATAGATWLIGP